MNQLEGKKIVNSLFPFCKTQDSRIQKDSELVTLKNESLNNENEFPFGFF